MALRFPWRKETSAPPARGRNERRLATLVQISDLHFGVPSAEDGAPPPADWLRRYLPPMDGLLGHHIAGIKELTHFLNILRKAERDPAPLVVVSGDITACGKTDEFDRAKAFLTATYDVKGHLYGVNESDVLTRTIPGNHDRWPGTGRIEGLATAGFVNTFGNGQPPAVKATRVTQTHPFPLVSNLPLPGGQILQLIGIDTDWNVNPYGAQRLFARGSFADQIDMLENDPRFVTPEENVIRVLVMHHSLAQTSYWLGIDGQSRRALENWIKKAGVSVILTGHLHRALGEVTKVSHRGKRWDLLEARSGTATQLDEMPASWAAKGVFRSNRLPLNSLLVHRLIENGGQIRWEVEYFERLHDGFQSRQPLPGSAPSSIVIRP